MQNYWTTLGKSFIIFLCEIIYFRQLHFGDCRYYSLQFYLILIFSSKGKGYPDLATKLK